MKVENFALDLHSEKFESSSSVVTSFVSELDSENEKRVSELKTIKDEFEFYKRLEFEMIQQLIFCLDSKNYKFKELDIEKFRDTKITPDREISVQKEYREFQKLDVTMCGFIQTNSQKIQIDIDISMSHSFVQKNQISKTRFYDPLVINFDGELPNLDTKSFSFDIDCDGEKDQISLLKSGSGFLALDRNNNNTIDDGMELFGTQNGNGFADLRRYDSDKNGWIDENDPIMEGLRIWIKTPDENRLVALGELGIGALYLGNTKNSFDIKNDANETLGRIQSNGLFLNEDGTSGLISQIDFARRQKEEINQPANALNGLLQMA